MCRLSINLVASTSWNPQGLSRPVMGLLHLTILYLHTLFSFLFPAPFMSPASKPLSFHHTISGEKKIHINHRNKFTFRLNIVNKLYGGSFIPFAPSICAAHKWHTNKMHCFHFIFFILQPLVLIADINRCTVNVHYEPPDDGLVKAETCVGVKE